MRRALIGLALLMIATAACGGGDDAAVEITDAWSRPATGSNGAVYLTIEGGSADTALTSVSVGAGVASMAQIHQTVMRDDGSMGMTELPSVDIPAGSTVMMVPGGVHVMLMGLAEPLEPGDEISVTLTFDDGTVRTVTADVRDE